MRITIKLRNVFYYETLFNRLNVQSIAYFLDKVLFTICLSNYIEDYHDGHDSIEEYLLMDRNQHYNEIHFFETRKRYNRKLIQNIVNYVVCTLGSYHYYEELPDTLKTYENTIGYIESYGLDELEFCYIPKSIIHSKKFSNYLATYVVKEFFYRYDDVLNHKFFKKLTIKI